MCDGKISAPSQSFEDQSFDVHVPTHKNNAERVDSWILFALSSGVEEFLFGSGPSISRYGVYKMPSCVFQGRWLVELRLTTWSLQDTLQLLKTLVLYHIGQSADVLEFILSKCPSLESLSVLNCFYGQRLVISVGSLHFRSFMVGHCSQIVIDAPTLQLLEFQGLVYLPKDCILRNLFSLIRLNLKFRNYKFRPICGNEPMEIGSAPPCESC